MSGGGAAGSASGSGGAAKDSGKKRPRKDSSQEKSPPRRSLRNQEKSGQKRKQKRTKGTKSMVVPVSRSLFKEVELNRTTTGTTTGLQPTFSKDSGFNSLSFNEEGFDFDDAITASSLKAYQSNNYGNLVTGTGDNIYETDTEAGSPNMLDQLRQMAEGFVP